MYSTYSSVSSFQVSVSVTQWTDEHVHSTLTDTEFDLPLLTIPATLILQSKNITSLFIYASVSDFREHNAAPDQRARFLARLCPGACYAFSLSISKRFFKAFK